MKNIKNYFFVLFVLSLVTQVIPAHDLEKQDITKLVQYLKQRDDRQKELEKDIKNLWSACFRKTVDIRSYGNTTTTTTKYYPRPICPSSKFRELYENRKEINSFRKDTQKQIGKILDEGVSINACDDHGKTALNYAQSRDQYNLLRKLGADFQLDAFAKTNEYELIFVAMLAAVWGYFVIDSMYVPVEKKKIALIECGINSRDEYGRTQLMNYIIARQEQFYKDRIYRCEISRLSFILKTNDEVSRMMQCGADLSIQDYEGKTVIDYCTIKEFYNHLRLLGGDFNLQRWALAYVGELFVGVAVSAFFILLMISTTNNEYSLDNDGEIGLKFDQAFEKGSFR